MSRFREFLNATRSLFRETFQKWRKDNVSRLAIMVRSPRERTIMSLAATVE